MKRFILTILIAVVFGANISCLNKEDFSISYSYMPNGFQSLDYTAVFDGNHVLVSYSVVLTKALYDNSGELNFRQISKSEDFSFEYKNISELYSSFQFLEKIKNQSDAHDYINEFKILTLSKQITVRIQETQEILDSPPSHLSYASPLLEFHRCILAEIGKELDLDWHCFYDDVLMKCH